MITTGILQVSSGVSRLNGTPLAIEGDADPFGAATNFLANRGLSNNDFIRVDGEDGSVGNMPVLFITDAGPAAAAAKKASKKLRGKKAGAKKAGAKKTAAKKTAAGKKSNGKKSGGRASGKRSAKTLAGKKTRKGSRKR